MGWLSTFVVYFAFPALFFKLLSDPVDKLASTRFIATSIGVTFAIFARRSSRPGTTRGALGEATIQGLAAAYGNIGYMGPSTCWRSVMRPPCPSR